MTQKLSSIVQFCMVIIGGCLLFICAPTVVRGQGGTGKVLTETATPAKTTPAKSRKSSRKAPTASKAPKTTRPNLENKSPSWKMVGVWRANSTEFGDRVEMIFTANADGTYQFFARNAQGATARDYGTWQYSDGILYQRFSNGASGKGSVVWLDNDTFEITIIDNGTPASSGMKRRYHRVK
jgi:hypothetical protein